MNAYQLRETQTYGYDNTRLSFDPTGTLVFGYDAPANWFTRFNFEASPGTAVRLRQFTGKERDSESGLDYFGARYYGSALGRFTSPDWSSAPQPVPYANLWNPQTLNLYAYVGNNPLSRADLDGHGWWDKLKNLFGDAGCWCEGEKAESAALRNLYAEQRRRQAEQRQQQEDLQRWRVAMKNPAYHIAMAMAMGPLGPVGEELEAAAAETGAAEEATEELAAGEVGGSAATANKIIHLFGKAEHLDSIVQASGGTAAAYQALQKATIEATRGISGQFETTVQIGGQTVTVRGIVMNGEAKIGTAFIPE